MVTVPAMFPVTLPVTEPMVTLPLLAVQVPPPVPSLSDAVPPTHTFDAVMATGVMFTDVVFVAGPTPAQPDEL